MEKKSIGGFISALRKSQGMTQQEVADRLNVSNKTISKWERDDGYPEITMIPAIAELFNVTSDEILRGERISREERDPVTSSSKSEKQVRFLLTQADTRFKNLSFLAIALIFIGLNCMFTISYAAYRPVIGFGVMLALIAAGAIIQMMAANALYSVYKNSELVDEQDDSFASGMRLLYKYAFATFVAAVFTVVLSLPLVAIRHTHYVDSVILFSEYLTLLPWLILVSIILCIAGKKIAGNLLKTTLPKEEVSAGKKQIIRALGKKTVIALVILLAITIGAQVTVNYLASQPRPALQFASLEEMEEFVEQAREYEEGKIYNQPMYENLSVFDWVDLKVHYAQDYDRLAARRSAIAGAFRFIYCAEIALVGIVYYRKRSRIHKAGTEF